MEPTVYHIGTVAVMTLRQCPRVAATLKYHGKIIQGVLVAMVTMRSQGGRLQMIRGNIGQKKVKNCSEKILLRNSKGKGTHGLFRVAGGMNATSKKMPRDIVSLNCHWQHNMEIVEVGVIKYC